ncbi:AraC family transcriptional regulator [Emticicia sp. TH156]|uniref:helix-turn-helix domain-containing protein n=1 Tax=Emticicia sp. TH156 TaxID=2067454 RepID=UPI000C7617F8|nr:AraC family transcriptional regulator [Emticicia sp. TH156]PLK44962.1 hypothetical protein C0V77_06870 [Emticicia sp. TH156]
MKKPYEFLYDSPPLSVHHELPENRLYPFAKAQESLYTRFDSASLLSQILNFRPFYAELLEVNSHSPFRMTYQINEKQHFLFFMLHGSIDFTDTDGLFISHARERHYAVTYNDRGLYRVKISPGRHVALCISILPEWLAFVSKDLPVLKKYLTALDAEEYPYAMLPYCRMDLHVLRWLRNIYAEMANGVGSLDGLLRLYISRTLERYNVLAAQQLKRMPYRVKDYLDLHFSDANLNSRQVADYFGMTERTLRNHFKAEFNITIRDYYTSCRLRQALILMKIKNLPVSDIYYQVGYNDESTFRYEMKKFKIRMA